MKEKTLPDFLLRRLLAIHTSYELSSSITLEIVLKGARKMSEEKQQVLAERLKRFSRAKKVETCRYYDDDKNCFFLHFVGLSGKGWKKLEELQINESQTQRLDEIKKARKKLPYFLSHKLGEIEVSFSSHLEGFATVILSVKRGVEEKRLQTFVRFLQKKTEASKIEKIIALKKKNSFQLNVRGLKPEGLEVLYKLVSCTCDGGNQ